MTDWTDPVPAASGRPPSELTANDSGVVPSFDWRAAARQAGVEVLWVLLALREAWPRNDEHRRPHRTSHVDRLVATDPEVPGQVAQIIEELARREQRGTA